MTAKEKLIQFLMKSDFVTLQEALAMGVNKMMLSRMVKQETLYRTTPRIYSTKIDWLTDPLGKYAPVCTLYPDAVICGISALTYYDLTDEEERKIWLAFPQTHRVVNQEYRLIYPRGISYSLGIVRHRVRNREVRMYDLEKTIVDTFKYHTEEVALKALKGYLKRKDKSVTKLCDYARRLRKPLDHIVTVLQADE